MEDPASPRRSGIAIVIAALIVAIGLILSSALPRYELEGRYTFDRWTGELCDRQGCWNPRR